MKRLPAMSLLLLALLLITPFQNLSTVRGATEDKNYFIRSVVTYLNPSGNTHVWEFSEDDRTLGLFMNNTWQTVELVNSTFPMETKVDEDGNSIAVLEFPNSALNPGSDVSFTVWYHIVSKPRTIPIISEDESDNLTEIPNDLKSKYTQKEGSWQTNNPTLQELADNLTGGERRVLSIVKNFVEWIRDHIDYPSPQARHEVPYYPNETYARREGDCDDQAMLLITLCRIMGIPSYLQTGCIYLQNRPFYQDSIWEERLSIVEQRIGWHGWAVVYVPPWGWLPVDLTYVLEGLGDPLNAIRHGAVTRQETIQYMNVSHTDYVASSLEARAFVIANGFKVYVEDEMLLDFGANPLTVGIDPWIPIVLTALVATFVVVASFVISRRWRKRIAEEEATPLPKVYE